MKLFNMKAVSKLFLIHREIRAGFADKKRLAVRFGDTERTIERYFHFLRELGAPIYYSKASGGVYCYSGEFDLTEEVRKRYGVKVEV